MATERTTAAKLPIHVGEDAQGFLQFIVAWDPDFDVIDLLQKPWKWDAEFTLWLDNGKPTSDEDESFERLIELIEKANER